MMPLGEPAPRRREIGGDDGPEFPELQRGDHGKPHRPAADHQRHLLAGRCCLRDGVDADGEWLGQRRVLGRQAVGHFDQQRLAQNHALREAAGKLVGVADRPRTVGSGYHRDGTDARAGFQPAFRARAVVEQFGTELMAEDDVARQVHRPAASHAAGDIDHAMAMLAGVQVGTADATGQRSDNDLTDTGHNIIDRIDHNFTLPENCCPHAASPARQFHVMYLTNCGASPVLRSSAFDAHHQ
jgi:hypothetical protein